MGQAVRALGIVGVLVVAIAGCGGGGSEEGAAPTVRAPAESAAATTLPPTTLLPSPVDQLAGVGDARQVISVLADGYGQTTATLVAYERDDGWHEVFGPWTANLGGNGFAPPDQKREGDLRTPSGAFGLEFAFGILADPGVRLPYRRITSSDIVWDDDPASPRYNLWSDTATDRVGADPEPMYNAPAYNYGVVIAYNADRVPGLGSAIFLHVSKGQPTAGCVALPQAQLIELVRWLDPARSPRIVMGTPDGVAP